MPLSYRLGDDLAQEEDDRGGDGGGDRDHGRLRPAVGAGQVARDVTRQSTGADVHDRVPDEQGREDALRALHPDGEQPSLAATGLEQLPGSRVTERGERGLGAGAEGGAEDEKEPEDQLPWRHAF